MDGMRFDLQQFLLEMREEQREDLRALSTKVDTGFYQLHDRISTVQTRVSDHETRVTVVEKTSRAISWFAGVVIMALFGAAATWVFSLIK